MSKVEIKAILKNKNDIHEFMGKGIKSGNVITYNDNGVLTKVILDDVISLERKSDYYIRLNFKLSDSLEGLYEIKEGNMNVKTDTLELNYEKNGIKIKYNLIINNVFIDTFWFYLQYTIDR